MSTTDARGPFTATYRQLTAGSLALVLLLVSAYASEVDITALADARGRRNAGELMAGLLSPDLSGAFVTRVLQLTVESVAIAVLGMLVALAIGVPLAFMAARVPELDDAPGGSRLASAVRGGLRWGARGVLSVLRSVPEIVWAYLFVRILGLGPAPAVLGIGVAFAGIVGKLFAELIDACDPAPVRVLRASGASRIGVVLYGVLPQIQKQWIGYSLFRVECAVRSAAILGVVGAGGIGAEIELSIRYFQYDKLATSLLALLVCVILIEIASAYLRQRPPGWSLAVLGVAVVAGFALLDASWSELWTREAMVQTKAFVAGFLPPTSGWEFLSRAGLSMAQTVAMAACATLVATLIALFLAPLASRVLSYGSYLESAPSPGGVGSVVRRSLFGAARLTLQLTRAIPELVWALVFIVWVGTGPFAGMLAIAVHTVGILGRLFGEVYEDCEARPPRLLEAAGAGPFARWSYGVVPQVAPRLAAFALFRFEVNVRATAMVGFVGAGGIGDAIHTAISLFHMSDLAALLLVLLATVVLVDVVGDRLRRQLLAP